MKSDLHFICRHIGTRHDAPLSIAISELPSSKFMTSARTKPGMAFWATVVVYSGR
jgi:hypothetical protein